VSLQKQRRAATLGQVGESPNRDGVRHQAPVDGLWVSVARDNGIDKWAFYSRVRRGWDPERAATEPARSRRRSDGAPSGEAWVSIAARNGIGPQTFWDRVDAGVSPATAATRPSIRLQRAPSGELWRDVAQRNGIKPATFYARVANGVDPELAATRPGWGGFRRR